MNTNIQQKIEWLESNGYSEWPGFSLEEQLQEIASRDLPVGTIFAKSSETKKIAPVAIAFE